MLSSRTKHDHLDDGSLKKERRSHPTLRGRLLLGVNLTLVVVLGLFTAWDYHVGWKALIGEKRTALQEEAKILISSIQHIRGQGSRAVQQYVDETCGSMQESTSPGHHIALDMAEETLQARAHHRASPQMLSAMRRAARTANGLARVSDETIVVGTAGQGDVTVYVSEYLSNIRQIMRGRVIRRVSSILLLAAGIVIMLNIILRWLLMKPLSSMAGMVRRFGSGELATRMPDAGTMELGLLSQEFNRMADALEKADRGRRLRMKKAHEIQDNLQPNLKNMSGLKVECFFQPAAEVSGDYYDVLTLGDGSSLFCVADVTGHDVPAAMGAAMLKAILQVGAERQYDPVELLRLINDWFCRVTLTEDFATMVLARWDPSNHTLSYTNAGHESGYLVRRSGEVETLHSTGPVLGIDKRANWETEDIAIEPGDRLIIHTDGLTETRASNGEMFGRERKRVLEILEETKSQPLNVVRDRLLERLESFRGTVPQNDDITFLAIEFQP